MSNHSLTATTTEERALHLLSEGVPISQVATTLGVTDSLISQFLSKDEFKSKLIEKKFEALQHHNARDKEYDLTEDLLIAKLKAQIPFLMRPMEIAKILSMVNAAKRRGQSSPDVLEQARPTVNLTIPVQILQHFTLNTMNQVIKAGQQELVTIQAGKLPELLSQHNAKKVEHVPTA